MKQATFQCPNCNYIMYDFPGNVGQMCPWCPSCLERLEDDEEFLDDYPIDYEEEDNE